MTDRDALRLHEEVLLLALEDDEGTIAGCTSYQFALAGALLAELLLLGRIELAGGKKKLVQVVDERPPGDAVLDDVLARLAGARRRASLAIWAGRLAGDGKTRHRIAEGLCRRGVLRHDVDKVLLLFTRRIYPQVDPEPERRLVARLEEAVFTDTADLDPRTVVLVSIAHATGLLRAIFGRRRLAARKRRLERIAQGDVVGAATREAVAAMQAAVMVSVIIPTIVMTSTS